MSKKTLSNQVKSHLEKLELKYEEDEEQKGFNFSFEMENTEVDIKIVCDEDNNRLFMSGFSSIKIPKDKRPAILEKINEIHWEDFWNAHLFINEETQHVMSYAVLYAMGDLHLEVFRETLYDVSNIIDTRFKDLMQIIVNPDLCELAMKMQDKNGAMAN